jgi:hypothetical protein
MALKSKCAWDCGTTPHTVTAAWKRLEAGNTEPYSTLTIRLASDDSDIRIGFEDENGNVKEGGPHLQADESWTFGPNAGTITPNDLFISGTADDKVTWVGARVE